MNRNCPNCRGASVRRSSTPATDLTWRDHFYARYRCRECRTQFWSVSSKARRGLGMLTAIVLAILLVVIMDTALNREHQVRTSEIIE